MRYWQICHTFCILAHIGMALAGLITFFVAGQDSMSRFSSARNFQEASDEQQNSIVRVTLPWATFGVAISSLVLNAGALIANSVFDVRRSSSYTQRRLPYIKILIILTIIGVLILGAADGILVGVLASRIHLYSVLGAPMALAAIAGFLAIATAICYVGHYRSCSKQQPPSTDNWEQPSYGYQGPSGGQVPYSTQQAHGDQSYWPSQQTPMTQPGYDNHVK